MRRVLRSSFVFAALISSGAHAATALVTTEVDRVLIDDTNYAGCLVYVTAKLSDTLANCPGKYLTLDCSGELGTSKSLSSAKLTAAYLALVTSKRVIITIDDSRKANNYCLAKYFEVTDYAPL